MIPKQTRIAVQQRVLPSYRIPFFDLLADSVKGRFCIFYGSARKNEMLHTSAIPSTARVIRGKNIHLFGGKFYTCWQAGLLRWVRTWRPHVLIMEANPRYPSSLFTMRWMKRYQRKLIGWGLGSPVPSGFLAKVRMALRKRFIRNFDALITYSKLGAEQYAALGFPPERIFVAPNAVAAKPTSPPPQRGTQFTLNKPQVLFVGRLQERKKVDVLIRACAALPIAVQPELHIVGDGPAHRQLQEIAQDIYPETTFYGAMHGEALAELFSKADLFVLPGTGGLAVQEAMSYALPVIVGQADGTQSNLVRPKNGWILNSGSVKELEGIMRKALSDVTRLRAMGAVSYTIVDDEVNLENMVSAFQKAIEFVLEEA